jgi:hypothetical protein
MPLPESPACGMHRLPAPHFRRTVDIRPGKNHGQGRVLCRSGA